MRGVARIGDQYQFSVTRIFSVRFRVVQDGTASLDSFLAAASDEDALVLLAGFTSGDDVGDDDFAAVLLERPINAQSLVTPSPSVSPTAGFAKSSSTFTATLAGTVAAGVAVIILVLAVWIWRRKFRRKSKGPQFLRSVLTFPNMHHPDSQRNPAGGWGSVNPIHGDAPLPYNSVFTSGGPPVIGERITGSIAPPAADVESTKSTASAGEHMGELASDDVQYQFTPGKYLVEVTSSMKNSAPLPPTGTTLPSYDPTVDQDTKKTSESAAEDVTGSTYKNSSGSSSLHLGISAAEAVMEAASALACTSNIPGIGETAMLVTLLVKLVVDHSTNAAAVDRRVRWCRSIVLILKRASDLLGKVNVSTNAMPTTFVIWHERQDCVTLIVDDGFNQQRRVS